jgi:hypothetical protein
MGNSLQLHTDKQYSIQEQDKFVENARKAYNKAKKKPHGGYEIDIRHFIGKSIEYKKSFALLMLVKKQFTISMIYDYSPQSLSQKMNISKYIIETYINRLLKVDYCHFTGRKNQHLQFIGLNKIMPERDKGCVIQITEKDNINSIVEKINIELLKNNFNNQNKLINIKSDLIKSETKGAKISKYKLEKAKQYADKHPEIKEERLVKSHIIGCRKIAQILGSSLKYAADFLNTIAKKGIVKLKNIVTKYADFEFNQFSSDELKKSLNKRSGYFFFWRGATYHFQGTEIYFF